MKLPVVLHNRGFLKLWGAQVFSQLGLNILNFVLILKVYEATNSNTSVSLLILAFGVPGLLLGYLAGSYVDKTNTRTVLLVTNAVRGLIIFSLFFMPDNVLLYYLVALVVSLASQFFIPAEGSLLPSIVPKEQLLQANSIFTTTLYVMTIVGFLFAGPSLRLFNTDGTVLLITVAFGLALLLSSFLPDFGRRSTIDQSLEFISRLIKGIKFVWKAKEVRNALFFLTLTQTIFLVIATVAPGYLDENLKIDVKEASLVLVAPAALGLFLGAALLHPLSDRYSQRFLVNAGILGMGVTLVFLTLTTVLSSVDLRVILTIVLALLLGFEIALINIPATTQMQSETHEELRGSMYGLLISLQSGASLFPIILAGAFADIFGVSFVLQLIGLLIFFLGVYRLRPRS